MKLLSRKAYLSIASTMFLGIAGLNFSPYAEASHDREHRNNEHRVDTDSRLSGNSLENQLWSAIQSHNSDTMSNLISPIYLGGKSSGFAGHSDHIHYLSHVNIDSFSITEVIESQSDDIRIIAYHFIANGPTAFNDRRVSVWQRIKHKHHQFFWQLISHSVLDY